MRFGLSRLIVVLGVAVVLLGGTAAARPRTVTILALDGDADPALRAQLAGALERAAQSTGATVTLGDTTLAETGAAIGCDHTEPGCAEQVRTTLGAEELVHGTVTSRDGQPELIVRRTVAGEPTHESTLVIESRDLEGGAEHRLVPFFNGHDLGEPGEPGTPTPSYDGRKRLRGILFTAAGGVTLAIGLTLWSTKASVQRTIDAAPTNTVADFMRLEELESRAFRHAMIGNVMVLGGLALGGYGAWTLYQDRRERRVTVAPVVTPTTAALAIEGQW